MTGWALGAGALGWAGMTMLLSQHRWFRRRRLTRRLEPYQPHSLIGAAGGASSLESLRDVLGPLTAAAGESVARAFGVADPLSVRLLRAGERRTVTDFRLHQTAWAGSAFVGAAATAFALDASPPLTAVLTVTAPLLTFLIIEQRVTASGDRHRERIRDELPVVTEQLAMLLQSGYSLNGALVRLSNRGSGAIGADLGAVTNRVSQGLTSMEALEEWVAVMDVEPLRQVVAICGLDHEMSDVGPLMSEEARAIRQQAQRRLIETIERRNEQVWIPVTVATLVPGLILLAIPFVDALQSFSVGS